MGEMTVVGISPLQQDRTCVSGQTCAFDGILGQDLSFNDHFAVMDTCGLESVVPRFTHSGRFQEVSASGGRVDWGQAHITAAGGKYRLCWCAATMASSNASNASIYQIDMQSVNITLSQINGPGNANGSNDTNGSNQTLAPSPSHADSMFIACSLASDFRSDAGTLTLVGVSPLTQDRTCVSGQTCFIDGVTGESLSQNDRVMVLDTCAADTVIPRFTENGFNAQAGDLLSSVPGASFSWGHVAVTATGGLYRLCWCAGDAAGTNSSLLPFACSISENFRVDMGALTLIGVSPLYQDRTCISGKTCSFDGITGKDLSSSDHFMILNTCAEESAIPRFAAMGFFFQTTSSGGTVTWGSTSPTAAGGQYRLCWCGAGFACSVSDHFRVDAGELTLVGPTPLQQDRTCVSGQTCYVDGITAQHLSHTDVVAILDTCAESSVLRKSPRTGGLLHLDPINGSGASFSWQSAVITSAGGQYRLCWCSVPSSLLVHPFAQNLTDSISINASLSGSTLGQTCSLAEDFRVDMGRLTLIGVSPLFQDRTCVSGRECTIDGILGEGLSNTDRFEILDTCGVPQLIPRFASAGMSASVMLTGARVTWGSTPMTSAGGRYRLCWCAGFGPQDTNTSQFFACSTADRFVVDAGELTVVGPSPLLQDRTCVSGRTCTVDGITGEGLTDAEFLMVLDTCGVESVLPRFAAAGHAMAPFQASGASMTWGSIRVTANGGEYRLCWCAGSASGANWTALGTSLPCSQTEDFRVDMGKFTLRGPYLEHSRTCVSGRVCAFDGLVGQDLQDGDLLMALDTCSSLATVPRFPASGLIDVMSSSGASVRWGDQPIYPSNESGIVGWGSAEVTAQGGRYRLCWCAGDEVHGNETGPTWFAGPGVITADGAAPRRCGFPVDAGVLTMVGPAPLTQHRTCVSGQECTIDGIAGLGLLASDHLAVLDTCGVPAVVAKWARTGISVSRHSSATGFNITEKFSSTTSFTWGTVQVTASGGLYRLCWCAGPVSDASSINGTEDMNASDTVSLGTVDCSVSWRFRVDVGQLVLRGTVPLAHTCVSGQTCALDGLKGQDLQDGDKIVVLDSCGAGKATLPSRFAHGGLITSATASGASVAWGSVPLTAAGGIYRLCRSQQTTTSMTRNFCVP
jgi:hypothetical protein